MKTPRFVQLIITALFIFGTLSFGFSQSNSYVLPEGDKVEGKIAFIELSCNACHKVGDVRKARSAGEQMLVILGEDKKSYGDLVSSIIDPSHKVAPKYRKPYTTKSGESKMLKYNDVITVQELVNLVAFLQDEYGIETPETCNCKD